MWGALHCNFVKLSSPSSPNIFLNKNHAHRNISFKSSDPSDNKAAHFGFHMAWATNTLRIFWAKEEIGVICFRGNDRKSNTQSKESY